MLKSRWASQEVKVVSHVEDVTLELENECEAQNVGLTNCRRVAFVVFWWQIRCQASLNPAYFAGCWARGEGKGEGDDDEGKMIDKHNRRKYEFNKRLKRTKD
jgi:hypothetical protein